MATPRRGEPARRGTPSAPRRRRRRPRRPIAEVRCRRRRPKGAVGRGRASAHRSHHDIQPVPMTHSARSLPTSRADRRPLGFRPRPPARGPRVCPRRQVHAQARLGAGRAARAFFMSPRRGRFARRSREAAGRNTSAARRRPAAPRVLERLLRGFALSRFILGFDGPGRRQLGLLVEGMRARLRPRRLRVLRLRPRAALRRRVTGGLPRACRRRRPTGQPAARRRGSAGRPRAGRRAPCPSCPRRAGGAPAGSGPRRRAP